MDFFKRSAFVLALATSGLHAAARPFAPMAPTGYRVSLLAEAKDARSLALSPTGKLYVGTMEAGVVHVVEGGKARPLLHGLVRPNGVAWREGNLYVAEISRLSVVRNVDGLKPDKPVELVPLKTDFPSDVHHGWKYIAFGPDGKLYVPVGAPCNVCLSDAPYASLHRLDADGKNLQTVATGIRNTVGFTWHPQTKKMWFTEMGRDMMGDNQPPDEINVLKQGAHYGYPFTHGRSVLDPYYHAQRPDKLVTEPPVGEIPAHSSPIGIVFTHGTPFAKDYPGCFFVAEHGSWNRSTRIGYQVSVGCLDKDGKVGAFRPFLTGFQDRLGVHGRPVDLKFNSAGGLLVSDDHGGKVWLVEKQ